ncbi:branched-chain-amino-acid aminotransferase-like protein 2 [Lytechinus variegatus]|uniref:branched-chain-amino-acid aminotransferase-like protein 2 n=1 Tax=Lytechinus variegatus TaxID=7654 RepID=UPI001BB10039|nr:branched-chain-amino-acid aminotransferase-like protein 2 [Lytechinus variegatus]
MAASSSESQGSRAGSRTIIWCVPRTVSTALTKSLSFIKDIEVWFEPFTNCRVTQVHVKQTFGLDLPNKYEGNEEIFKRVVDRSREFGVGNITKPEKISYASIGRQLEKTTSRHVLVKDMALAVSKEQKKFIPKGFKHIFLIRHPLRVFNSTRKSMFNQQLDLGLLTGEAAVEETFDFERDYQYANGSGSMLFKDLYDMWKFVQEELGQETVIFDSDEFLSNPSEMLPKICQAAGLPYNESLLKWDSSIDVTKKWMVHADGYVDKLGHFFETAINSCEFLPPSKMPSRDEVTPDVIRCTDRAMKYYDEMYEVRLKV